MQSAAACCIFAMYEDETEKKFSHVPHVGRNYQQTSLTGEITASATSTIASHFEHTHAHWEARAHQRNSLV